MLCCLLIVCTLHFSQAIPNSVLIRNKHVEVNEQQFFIKGVAYAPTPISHHPLLTEPFGDYFTSEYRAIWQRDLPLIEAMGANTIRLYAWNYDNDHSEFLDMAMKYHIRVLVPLSVGSSEWFPYENIQTELINAMKNEVKRYKGHQAVLGYMIGNEMNAPWNGLMHHINTVLECKFDERPVGQGGCFEAPFSPSSPCYAANKCIYDGIFAFLDRAAEGIRESLADAPRLVTSPLADLDQLVAHLAEYDRSTRLDLWSVQVYRGRYFGRSSDNNFIVEVERALPNGKPLFFSEYGVDAYFDPCGLPGASWPCYNTIDNPMNGYEDEETQSDWVVDMSRILLDKRSDVLDENNQPSGPVVGGLVMAWIDELWKTHQNVQGCYPQYGDPKFNPIQCDAHAHADCPNHNLTKNALCGFYMTSFPDHYVNEGWFGVMKPHQSLTMKSSPSSSSSSSVDILTSRLVYSQLQKLWTSTPQKITSAMLWQRFMFSVLMTLIGFMILIAMSVSFYHLYKRCHSTSTQKLDFINTPLIA